MATKAELMAEGIAAGPARGLGLDVIQALVPAGTNQATAAVITSPLSNSAATTSSTGALLPAADNKAVYVVRNSDASNALLIYPSGAATINGATSFSIAATKGAAFYPDGTNWLAILSA